MSESNDIVLTALSSPEGCRSLLAAMYELIYRTVEFQKGSGKSLMEYVKIDQWIIPSLKKIAEDPFHDKRLHGFVLCLMGGITNYLEMGMFELALADLEEAQRQLEGYGDDDVDMEPLDGPVMINERFKSIADLFSCGAEIVL